MIELTSLVQCIVGIWIPIWQIVLGNKSRKQQGDSERQEGKGHSKEGEENVAQHEEQSNQAKQKALRRAWLAAVLLGSAMVARGEIGLLIIEIGHNKTPYVSDEGFITGVWAILLNTILGPVTVGLLVRFHAEKIVEGEWGLQEPSTPTQNDHSDDRVV